MKKKHLITGRQPLYAILKWPIYVGLYFFYRKYKVKGFKNIPRGKPIIFAMNHQNAFLDPLVAAPLSHTRQITFMLRSSIYSKKSMKPLLVGLNLLPVYRQSDGLDVLDKNTEVFDNCIYLLQKKRPIFIFPEGTHNNKRSLRPAKKGLARIALAAEEKNNFNLDIHIVPLGINYSDPYNFGSDVLINIGKSIDVASYKDIYLKNPAAVMNQLRLEVDRAMRELAIDIQHTDVYHEIETVREILVNDKFKNRKPSLHESFNQSKKIIHAIENTEDKTWAEAAATYKKHIDKTGIRDYMMQPSFKLKNEWLYLLFFVLFAPVFVVGTILNIIPFIVPVKLSQRIVKDPVFHASIMFGIGLFLFPIYYLIICLPLVFILSWKWAGLVLLTGGVTGIISLFYIRKLKKYLAWRKLNRLKKSGDKHYTSAVELRKHITAFFQHAN